VNGISLEQAVAKGLISLLNDQVRLSLLLFGIVNANPEYTVCPPEYINPLNCMWEHLESVDLATLTMRQSLEWLRGNRIVPFKVLRPGATGATAKLMVRLFDPKLNTPRCFKVEFEKNTNTNPTEIQVGRDGATTINLSEGGNLVGVRDSPKWDMLSMFPRFEQIPSVMLPSQVKRDGLTDINTGELTKGQMSAKSFLFTLKSQFAGCADIVIPEVFTDKEVRDMSKNSREKLEYYSIVDKNNWVASTGPLFESLPRVRPILAKMIRSPPNRPFSTGRRNVARALLLCGRFLR
jgi:hypothetical protein